MEGVSAVVEGECEEGGRDAAGWDGTGRRMVGHVERPDWIGNAIPCLHF